MVRKQALILGLAALVAVAMGVQAYASLQEQAQAAGDVQPISWEHWLLAKAKAEENDAAGNLVAALQYYLEYVRQAQGLGSSVRVAWGKNNAAYMIIKMHMRDASVDLAPARKMLEEGLAIAEATEDCRRIMAANLEYVKASQR
jgi:hypothetical protein